jgi:hypothetical protein
MASALIVVPTESPPAPNGLDSPASSARLENAVPRGVRGSGFARKPLSGLYGASWRLRV